MIRAEGIAATVAVELIAADAEELSASRARCGFEEDISAIFVVFDGEAVKDGFTGGADGGILSCIGRRNQPKWPKPEKIGYFQPVEVDICASSLS